MAEEAPHTSPWSPVQVTGDVPQVSDIPSRFVPVTTQTRVSGPEPYVPEVQVTTSTDAFLQTGNGGNGNELKCNAKSLISHETLTATFTKTRGFQTSLHINGLCQFFASQELFQC